MYISGKGEETVVKHNFHVFINHLYCSTKVKRQKIMLVSKAVLPSQICKNSKNFTNLMMLKIK